MILVILIVNPPSRVAEITIPLLIGPTLILISLTAQNIENGDKIGDAGAPIKASGEILSGRLMSVKNAAWWEVDNPMHCPHSIAGSSGLCPTLGDPHGGIISYQKVGMIDSRALPSLPSETLLPTLSLVISTHIKDPIRQYRGRLPCVTRGPVGTVFYHELSETSLRVDCF
jgi:hypothetical protein